MVSPPEILAFVLLTAVAGLHHVVLDPALDVWRRGHVAAAPAVLLALFAAYLTGTVLVYVRVSPVPVSPAAGRRLAGGACAAAACALLLHFAVSSSLVPFQFFLAAEG